MHENDLILELGRIALLIVVGAFGGLARLFNTDVPITMRNAVKHAIGGAVAATVGSAFALWLDPTLNEKITLLIGLAVMAGFLGINAVSEILSKRLHYYHDHQEPRNRRQLEPQPDSVEIRKLIDSGEFTQEEIEKMVAEVKARRKKKPATEAKNTDRLKDNINRPH
jgi:hypothetical protein